MREIRADRTVIDLVVPQSILRASTEDRRMRPGRIGIGKSGVALEARIGVVGAENDVLGEFARERIAQSARRGVRVVIATLARGGEHVPQSVDIGRTRRTGR